MVYYCMCRGGLRPIQNRLLHNFRNTRLTRGSEPVFLLIDLLEIKKGICVPKAVPLSQPSSVIHTPTTWGDCHNHRSNDEGSSGAGIDFYSACTGVNTVTPVGHVEKISGLYPLLTGYRLDFLSLPPSICLCGSVSYMWGRLISNTHTHTHSLPPHWLWGYLFWGWFGPCRGAHALCRKYCPVRCRRKAINALLSSVILGKLKGSNAPAERPLIDNTVS